MLVFFFNDFVQHTFVLTIMFMKEIYTYGVGFPVFQRQRTVCISADITDGLHISSISAFSDGKRYFFDFFMFVNVFGNIISARSEEHTSELQSRENLVCRLLL